MKEIFRKEQERVVRFDRGELWPACLLMYAKKQEISGAFFYGLGGCINPEIAYYDLAHEKKYIIKKFPGIYEVLNITGNIGHSGDHMVVHSHAMLGRVDYHTFGGHLISAEVGGTLELYVTSVDSKMKRIKNEDIGLHLFE